ncbi:MAG: hypothetical protein FWC21_07390 [Treponema sp.]|nr:hypothetical protein [Treponema sp.]
MNKKINFFSIFICFTIPWVITYLLHTMIRVIYNYWGDDTLWSAVIEYILTRNFWLNFLPALFMLIIGIIINFIIFNKIVFLKKYFKILVITGILFLIIFDQTVQFFVVKYNEIIFFPIVENWLYINPLSIADAGDDWVSMGRLPVSLSYFIMIFVFLSGIFTFRFLIFLINEKYHLYAAVIFIFSGYICSFLNRILYNYGFDYIEIFNLQVMDIKDIYLAIGLSLGLQSLWINYKHLDGVKRKDFLLFINNEYLNIKYLFKRKKISEIISDRAC